MASISESFAHQSVRNMKWKLQDEARQHINGHTDPRARINEIIHSSTVSDNYSSPRFARPFLIRLMTDSLKRSERLKVRQMAGVSKQK